MRRQTPGTTTFRRATSRESNRDVDWKAKFDHAEAGVETNEAIEQDFYLQPQGASAETIARLKSTFPFAADDYVEFLRRSDGADIAQCRFVAGDRIVAQVEQYGDVYPPDRWLPFGYDAGAVPLLLHESGKVALGEGNGSTEVAEFLADSFASFLSDVILGQRYGGIFRVPGEDQADFYAEEIAEDPWLAFLVEQGWVTIK